jgi:hypothetical protein
VQGRYNGIVNKGMKKRGKTFKEREVNEERRQKSRERGGSEERNNKGKKVK